MEEGKIIYFFNENGKEFNNKLAYAFKEYLEEIDKEVENLNTLNNN